MADFRHSARAAAVLVLVALMGIEPALAGEADLVAVKVRSDGGGSYSFDVTVRHGDTGWDHYANAWEVVAPDGKTVFGTRTLFHPHKDEQPFTRSLSGVKIPDGIDEVIVRARDSVHGLGGAEMTVKLER